jgi:hypothetical protein
MRRGEKGGKGEYPASSEKYPTPLKIKGVNTAIFERDGPAALILETPPTNP